MMENILCNFYEEWLVKDDSNYNEMETHITEEIEMVVAEANKQKAA